MKDLIYQNYNHACICFWGISNEITIHGEKPGLVDNHRDLNALVKELDPTRDNDGTCDIALPGQRSSQCDRCRKL